MVVDDDPIPSNLSDRMRNGLLMLDLDGLHEKDRATRLLLPCGPRSTQRLLATTFCHTCVRNSLPWRR